MITDAPELSAGSLVRVRQRTYLVQSVRTAPDTSAIVQAFNNARHPVRILIGTDAAREGVNLQAQCADLFHFDLP